MADLDTRVQMTVRSSQLQSVPVDDTLAISGQAADAAAVGAALALKADVSQVTGIKVNGESPDAQGLIYIDGGDIPVSGSDSTKIDAALEALDGKTAEDIPMSSDAGAQSIADAVNGSIARNADAIPMEAGSTTMVGDAIEDLQEDVGGLQEDVTAIQAWTAADVPYAAGGDSVKKKIDDTDTAVTAIQAWTAADVPYAAGGDSVKKKIDDLYDGRVTSVNGVEAGSGGNVALTTVPYADDLTTEDNVQVDAPFIVRTAGGQASIRSGHAWAMRLKGNCVHTGFVPEELSMEVQNAAREDPADEITAELDRDTFVAYVGADAVISLVYSTAWTVDGNTVDPADYGVTVTGTPAAGDAIVIRYVKEVRGTITPATPEKLVSTGWNLYNHTAGYARVAAYDGFYKVMGAYSTIRWAETPTGTTSAVVVDGNGLFEVPGDGFILITGGNSTDTAVICCWSDWEDGYDGDFQAYSESVINLSAVMASMTYGLCSVGGVYDEINFNTKQIIPRVKRVAYSAEAREAAEESGLAYDFDTDYIYIEMTAEETAAATSSFQLENQYDADGHGIEYFTETDAPVGSEIAYGMSLKDRLRRDVLTISQQTLNADQKAQVLSNIGADALVSAADAAIRAILTKALVKKSYSYKYASISANSTLNISAGDFGITEVDGYAPIAVVYYTTGNSQVTAYTVSATDSGTVMSLRNTSGSAITNKTAKVSILFARKALV